MGVVFNGDNPTRAEIGVHHGTSSSSSIGTKASRQAYDTKRLASCCNTSLKHQSGTSNEEDTIITMLETYYIYS
jgi:hypothetical protein